MTKAAFVYSLTQWKKEKRQKLKIILRKDGYLAYFPSSGLSRNLRLKEVLFLSVCPRKRLSGPRFQKPRHVFSVLYILQPGISITTATNAKHSRIHICQRYFLTQ